MGCCPALHSAVLLRGTAAAQRPQARRLLNCFLRGSDIKSTYKPELKRGCVGHCLPRELLTAPGTATVFRCCGHCYNPAQLRPCKELLPAPCSSFQPYSSEPSHGWDPSPTTHPLAVVPSGARCWCGAVPGACCPRWAGESRRAALLQEHMCVWRLPPLSCFY